MPGIENLSKALQICLKITFAVGLFVTVFLSFILKRYFAEYFVYNARYYRACLLILTPCGLCSLNILWQLIGILKTLDNKNPFVLKNVTGFKRIAVSSFIISVLFFILMLVQATVFTFAVGYIFLIAGFCFVILAGLFQKAVEYKDENDLTV